MSESSNVDDSVAKAAKMVESPWFKEAYKSALQFYEKDSALDSKDRLELSKTFVNISRAQLWGGWAAFAVVFGSPFAYRLYKTGAVRGVKVPRYFALGLLAMFGTSQFSGRYAYKSKLAELNAAGTFESTNSYDDEIQIDSEGNAIDNKEGTKPSNQRQYEMLKLLGFGMAPRWGAYFYATFNNPDRRLPDPKAKLQELKEGKISKISPFLNQRDPIGLYSGPGSDKKEGIPGLSTKSGSDSGNRDSEVSSWDRVRQEHGVSSGVSGTKWSEIRRAPSESGFSASQKVSSQSREDPQDDFDALLERERRGEDTV